MLCDNSSYSPCNLDIRLIGLRANDPRDQAHLFDIRIACDDRPRLIRRALEYLIVAFARSRTRIP